MELLLLVILVGGGIAGAAAWSNRQRRQREQEELAAVKRTAEEDVTRLGEDVAALDTDVAGRELDEGMRQDYRRALDSYDNAKTALDATRKPEDIQGVTTALEDGRYAVASVRAMSRSFTFDSVAKLP